MKTILWMNTGIRATPTEREARRPLGRDPHAYREMLNEYGQVVRWADEFGIEAVGTTEHHFQTEGGEMMPNSLLLYAKLAAETKNVIFMPLTIVLATHDPIRVAEDLALFNHLYPGRLQVGFARGYQTRWVQTLTQREKIASTPRDPEADANNRERFEEYLEILHKAWEQDSWNHDGKNYQAPYPATGIPDWPLADWTRRFGSPDEVDENGTIRKIGVVPKPFTQPRIFIPSVLSKQTMINAARRGHGVLIFEGDPERFRAAAQLYREEAHKAGYDFGLGQNVGAVRKVFLGETFEEAFEDAVRTTGYWYRNFFGNFGYNEAYRTEADDPDRMVEFESDRDLVKRMVEVGAVMCGTPEQIRGRMEDLSRCHGDGDLEWLVWEFSFLGTPGDENYDVPRRQIELYSKYIKPYVS